MTSPEAAHAAYVKALSDKYTATMSEDEEAVPAEYWPPEALDRLAHAIKYGFDDDEPVATPELNAIEELHAAISAARAQLEEPTVCMQLRHDDGLPPTPMQRKVARTAIWNLRIAVAHALLALAPETGDDFS